MYGVKNRRLRELLLKVSSTRRQARARYVLRIIERLSAAKGPITILDLGGEPGYWQNFDRAYLGRLVSKITLVNPKLVPTDDPLFVSVEGDARSLPDFTDNSFDFVHSNSVIEHVGGWPDKEAFAREVARLAPVYFVQTPYQWFPIEPHWIAPFIHWCPEHLRAKWIMWTRKAVRHDYRTAMRIVESARLLDRTQMRCLFSDAKLESERFLGLTKSVMAIRSPD